MNDNKQTPNFSNQKNNFYRPKDFLIVVLISMIFSFIYIQIASNWFGIYINFQPSLDMKAYFDNARGIIYGVWPGTEPFFRAPLYSYILATMLLIGKNLYGVVIIQAFFFSISAGIIYLTANKIFNRLTGWIASLLLLFYGGAFYWIVILHSTIFELFFASITLYFAVSISYCLKEEICKVKNILLNSFGAGVSFALLCLIRTNFLIIIPFFAIGYFIISYKQKRIKTFLLMSLLIAVICIAFWSPVALHNKIHSGSYLTTNATPTWSYANTEGSDVFNAMTPYGKELKISTGKFWQHQLSKMIAYWSSFEYPQNVNYYLFKDNILILKFLFIPFGIIASLFIIGIFINYKSFNEYWPCLAFFFPYYISISFFFIIGRFRIPAIPPMLIIGAACIYFIFENFKKAKYLKSTLSIILVFVFFSLTNPLLQPIPSYSYRGLAVAAMFKGNYPEAVKNLSKIKKLNVNSAELLTASLYLNGNRKQALILLDNIKKTTGKNYFIENNYIIGKNKNLSKVNLIQHPILFFIITSQKKNNENSAINLYTKLYQHKKSRL